MTRQTVRFSFPLAALALLGLGGSLTMAWGQEATQAAPAMGSSAEPTIVFTHPEDCFNDYSEDPVARFITARPWLYRSVINVTFSNKRVLPRRVFAYVNRMAGETIGVSPS